MSISRHSLFLVLLGLFVPVLAVTTVCAQDASVKPGINEGYKTIEIDKAVQRFEGSKRDIAQKTDEVIAACQLKSGMTVADVGAGTGLFTRLIAPKVQPEGKVYAVDITQGFLDHVLKTCKEKDIENVVGVLCTPTSTELPPDSVDLVFACDTYHHFEYPFKMLDSIRKSLRTGGHLILIDRTKASGHVRANQEMVIKEVTAKGFKLINKSNPTGKHYLMRFEKLK